MHILDVEQVGPAEPGAIRIEFGDDLVEQVDRALSSVADWPREGWKGTKFVLDDERDSWTEPASADRLHQLLRSSATHGWPFLLFARPRSGFSGSASAESFSQLYLGVWPSRRAFAAQVIAAVDGQWRDMDDSLDDAEVDEICAGFSCIDVEDRVWVFDLVPSQDDDPSPPTSP